MDSRAAEHSNSEVGVAVIVVTWNGRAVIDDCCRSLLDDDSPGIRTRLVVVDNGSTDGTAERLAEIGRDSARVELVRPIENTGFCRGNNMGWQHVRRADPAAEFVVLLNHDTVVDPGWLVPLVEALRADPSVAAVQPKLLLEGLGSGLNLSIELTPSRINSAGNRSHYLGFGFTLGFDESDGPRFDQPAEIDFPSGAAVMIRASALETFGLFEPEMFAYLEDADLGWKLRQAGLRVRYVPTSRVRHKYVRKADWSHYENLERNRWWLLLVYYRKRTLLLLLPTLAMMELGQLVFAARQGVLVAKLRAWSWFLQPANLRRIRELRAKAKERRVLTDREFMGNYSSTIDSTVLSWRLARVVVNSVFHAYFVVARRLIRW